MPAPAPSPSGPSAGDARQPFGSAASETTSRPGLSRGYVVAWAVLGAMSAGYLGIAAWDGTAAGGMSGDSMSSRVARLSSDVSQLRTKVAGLAEQQGADHERLAALQTTVETRLAGIAAGAAKAAATGDIIPAPASDPVKTVTVPGVMLVTTKPPSSAPVPAPITKPQADAASNAPSSEPALPPRKPTKILASAPTAETQQPTAEARPVTKAKSASTPKTADAFKPVVTVAAPASSIETGSLPARANAGPVGLEVASASSLDGARQSWGGIASRAGDALSGAEPRIMPSLDGTQFRVIAGPYTNEVDAQRACAALKARGIACRATGFGGAPL